MTRHSILREGFIAGVLGATGVAVWFLIVDTVAGHPLYTPRVLGTALFTVLGPLGRENPMWYLVAYTIFHYAVFCLIGVIAVAIVHAGHNEPGVLAGLLILFVAFEVGFYGFTALLAEALPLGALAWYQVAIGNLVAAGLMGTYLWRAHPALGREFSHALDGTE